MTNKTDIEVPNNNDMFKSLSRSIINKIVGDRRGQFVVLAAVVIAAFMFTLAITISQLSTMRQEVPYEPVDELALAITGDFERCLTRALAAATQKYCESWDLNSAKETGNEFVNVWRIAILESYNGFGTDIRLTIGEGMGEGVGWEIRWDNKYGMSMIYTTFDMDVEVYGLKGLTVTMQKVVRLNILDAKTEFSDAGNKMVIAFQICLSDGRSYFRPISDLAPNDLRLLVNGTMHENYEVIGFNYLGMGNYSVTFDFRRNEIIAENVTLIVTTTDGIMVAATQRLCVLTLQSDNVGEPGIENEGAFNIEINGFKKTSNPPYTTSLFPGQTITISFNLEGANFLNFSSSGPIDLAQDGATALVTVTDHGQAIITAIYGVPPREATLNLTSREEGSKTADLGSIELKFTNGTTVIFKPPATVMIPCSESIIIRYYPDTGYVFKCWEASTTIVIGNSSSSETAFIALRDGSITAVYRASRPEEWQTIYISPVKGGVGREKEFILELYPPPKDAEISPPLNRKFDERSGNTTKTTPTLRLGENVTITLYAKYTKQGGRDYVDVKVTLGFFASNGTFFEIGNSVIRVVKSSGHLEHKITLTPKVDVVPEGSIMTLILTRMDEGTGTLHILCGPYKSSIKLW